MSSKFNRLRRIFKILLSKNGCPWDRAQTHKTLLKYLREETKEFAKAVKSGRYDEIKEELGDILLQVMFHAQLAQNRGKFDINDVIDTLVKKLYRRHPHVFKRKKSSQATSVSEVLARWNEIKRKEKK